MFSFSDTSRFEGIDVIGSTTEWTLKRSRNPCAPNMWVVTPSKGCVFGCLFCPTRFHQNDRYQINLHTNLIDLLECELMSRNRLGKPPIKVLFDILSDPFQPIGDLSKLVHKILLRVLERGCEVFLVTRGIVPDGFEDIFRQFADQLYVQVSFFSMDSHLAGLFEQHAPAIENRLESIRRMLKWGVDVGARLGPFIPFISDTVGHIEDLLRYLRSVGVRHCCAGYLALRPHMLESFKQALPRAQYQLIKGSFQGQAWRREGIQKMTKFLPSRIRLPGYERVSNLARRIGMDVEWCACMNSRHLAPRSSRSCFEPAYRRVKFVRQRGQLELFRS